jgi:hypothetical protein
MKSHAATLLLSVVALAGCATATPYQAMHDDYGYSEQKLENNRYRVWFAGNSKTPRETVENYVLYRAAELTLANGYDYFLMSARSTEGERDRSSGIRFGIGGFSFGSHSGVSLGVGSGTSLGGKANYYGQADIALMKGKKPANDPTAFDAHELKANLEPSIVRGPPRIDE